MNYKNQLTELLNKFYSHVENNGLSLDRGNGLVICEDIKAVVDDILTEEVYSGKHLTVTMAIVNEIMQAKVFAWGEKETKDLSNIVGSLGFNTDSLFKEYDEVIKYKQEECFYKEKDVDWRFSDLKRSEFVFILNNVNLYFGLYDAFLDTLRYETKKVTKEELKENLKNTLKAISKWEDFE